MPEIAEVFLMSQSISDIAYRQQISNIEILGGRHGPDKNGDSRAPENFKELCDSLPMKLSEVKTKGKKCYLKLTNDNANVYYILISFGMSGSIYYEPTDEQLLSANVSREIYMKHFHIKVCLNNNNSCFYYGDIRRFGTWQIFTDTPSFEKQLDKLGPPIVDFNVKDYPKGFTDEDFVTIFRQKKNRQKIIAQTLMNQEVISGVGNYIRAEALYRAKIYPFAKPDDLSDTDLILLSDNLHMIAVNAYHCQGTSLYTYTGAKKEKGNFQDFLHVYNKSVDPYGNPVKHEKTPDKRTIHWVPFIQTIGCVL